MPDRSVPILPSRDLDEALAFYEKLGFENRGAPPGQWDYLMVGRGGVEIHFHADPDTGSRLVAPVDTDYDMREFAVVDRSGNLVRVGSPRAH